MRIILVACFSLLLFIGGVANAAFSIVSGPNVNNITTSSAQITWSLSDYGTGQVQYGTTTAYGKTSTLESSFKFNAHIQNISGLAANTLYYIKVVSKNSAGVTVSKTGSFKTLNPVPTIISGPGASNITQSSALITWSLSEVATGQVKYGTSTAYGKLSAPESSFKFSTHTQTLSGLTAGTVYHYQVVSKNAAGYTVTSVDKTFTTVPAITYTYSWVAGSFGACSATACGTSGTQTRTVQCKRNDGLVMTDVYCTATKPAISQSCSAPACAPPPPSNGLPQPPAPSSTVAPVSLIITPSFKTAGVIVELPGGAASNVTAKLYYKPTGSSSYFTAHAMTRYDVNNMATSMFDLLPNTNYDIRVDYTSGGVMSTKMATMRTKVDSMAYPAALRTINVSSISALQSALNNALPGDHIVLAAGTYSGHISLSGKSGTAANPIVVVGAVRFDPLNPSGSRAIIDGGAAGVAMEFVTCSYIIVDNLEIRNGGTQAALGGGVYFNSSYSMSLLNSYVHDNGKFNVGLGKSSSYATLGGPDKVGHHRIQNNFITDTSDQSGCPADAYNGCEPITYYGVSIQNFAGGGSVIRNNKITRHIDNISACGNFSGPKDFTDSTAHVLKLTDSSGAYFNHDTEIYENTVNSGLDDDIEMDGVCVNLRVYNNTIGIESQGSVHPLTLAAMGPGPAFIVKNVIRNYKSSAVKFNTGGTTGDFTKNAFLYHNTWVKQSIVNTYGIIDLWYGGSGYVSVKNIQFKNNIFYAPNGSKAIDINPNNCTTPGAFFNYNLWYTPSTMSNLFEWYNGSVLSNSSSFAAFKSASGQEANGIFLQPNLDSNYEPMSSSPVIDKALRIPGINDSYTGSGPDIGAKEY